jgi:hypothetical protein
MKKDWTGTGQGVFVTLGASNHSKGERAKYDYYATPPRALDAVYPYLNIKKPIWECSCGEGSLSKELKNKGYTVRESDIVVRSYPCEELDFLFLNDEKWDGDILTNPPFSLAKEFVFQALKCLKENNKLLLYLRVQFLESQNRRSLFDTNPPKYVLVYSKRTPQCAKNGEFGKPTGNAAMFCWFVWEKGFKGDPTIKWI